MPFIALAAAALAGQAPPEPAYALLACPWGPAYYAADEQGASTPEADSMADQWLSVLQRAPTSRIVLRMHSNEKGRDGAALRARDALAWRRLDAVRARFVRAGIRADRIMYNLDMSDDGFAPEGWTGSWIYPEFYLRAGEVRLIVPDRMIC